MYRPSIPVEKENGLDGVGIECGYERYSVPEVRGSSGQLGSEGRLLQSGLGAVRRSWKLEYDAVAADRKVRLFEAHSASSG